MPKDRTEMEKMEAFMIEASTYRGSFREIWSYRGLLYFLIWRDIKVRYKQTLFGVAWAVLQPFFMMIVFSIFLGVLAQVPSDGIPYPLFAYSALVPWTLFAQSLLFSSNSLVDNLSLVSKIYFPRLLLPIAATGSFLLDFGIASILLLGMMAIYGVTPTLHVLWAPVFALLATVTALAVGIFLAAVNARFRDVRYAVPFVVQVWLFASPVAYSSSLLPEGWQWVYGLNPMAGVIEGFRWALLDTGGRLSVLTAISAATAVGMLLISIMYFRKVEKTVADII